MHSMNLLASILFFCATASQATSVASFFSDHMVLQRNMKVPIWGTGSNAENITVTFNGQTKTVVAGSNGKWVIHLDSMQAGGPFQLKVQGATTIMVNDVMVGEVWFASGQSNMAYSLNTIGGANVDSATTANYPNLRFLNYQAGGNWQACTPAVALNFSATAYYFSRDLQKSLNVPVGVMLSAIGGTDIERWMDSASIAADSLIAADTAAGTLYRQWIAPLVSFGIRGVIWYQGENNANEPYPAHPNWSASHYQKRFQALILGWRKVWGQGDFPFYYVQLPSVNGLQTNPVGPTDTWAMIREAQRLALSVKNTGMAVTLDLGENATAGTAELHPWDKWDVGRRLWLIASSLCYGNTATVYSGPMFTSMTIQGNKINLHFQHTDGGLVAKGGTALTGFTIAGSNNNWVWGTATVNHDTIVVTSVSVAAPTQVLYACAHYPIFNLCNGAGLPASPFMTNGPQLPVSLAPAPKGSSPASQSGHSPLFSARIIGKRIVVTTAMPITPVTVSLFDVSGKRVAPQNGRAEMSIDVSRLPKGVYFMKAETFSATRTMENEVICSKSLAVLK
jgi:sialate O-acetylesterase